MAKTADLVALANTGGAPPSSLYISGRWGARPRAVATRRDIDLASPRPAEENREVVGRHLCDSRRTEACSVSEIGTVLLVHSAVAAATLR